VVEVDRHPATSEAMIRWAAINTITRRSLGDAPRPGDNGALSRQPDDLLKQVLRLS
jgi:hypothetical protein